VINVHLRAAFLLSKLALPGNVCAEIRGDSEYIEPFGEVGVRVGLGVCGSKSRVAGTYPRDGRGSCAKWCARERHLPESCDRNVMSKELGNTLAKRLNVSPEEQLKGFSEFDPAGPWANRDGNRAGSALPLL